MKAIKYFVLVVPAFTIIILFLNFLSTGFGFSIIPGRSTIIGHSIIERFNVVEERRNPPQEPVKLSNDRVFFPIFDSARKSVFYYEPGTGFIKSVALSNINGDFVAPVMVAEIKPRLEEIRWLSSGKSLIAMAGDVSYYYDLSGNYVRRLNKPLFDSTLSVRDYRVAFLDYDEMVGKGYISVYLPADDLVKKILPTRSQNWEVAWASQDSLSLINWPGSRPSENYLFILNVNDGSLRKLLEGRSGLEVVWSPLGTAFIFSETDRLGNVQLSFFDVNSATEKRIGDNLHASSCIWDNKSRGIFCFDEKFLVYINIGPDKQKTIIRQVDAALIDTGSLFLTGDEKYLIYKSRADSKLYGLWLDW